MATPLSRVARVAVALAIASGCSAFGSSGGGGGGDTPPGRPDGSDDSAPDGDASILDAPDDGPFTPLPNPGFEESTLDAPCVPGWGNLDSVSRTVSTAHTGSRACLVCNASGTGGYTIFASAPFSKPGTYTATAWFHQADNDGSAGVQAQVAVQDIFDGGLNGDNKYRMLTNIWEQGQVSYVVPPGAFVVNVVVGGQGQLDSCVIVDDVALIYTPP